MLVVQPVGHRNHSVVKPVITSLVAANEQDRATSRIEGKQRAERPPLVLRPQFFPIGMPRALNGINMRSSQMWSKLPQKFNAGGN